MQHRRREKFKISTCSTVRILSRTFRRILILNLRLLQLIRRISSAILLLCQFRTRVSIPIDTGILLGRFASVVGGTCLRVCGRSLGFQAIDIFLRIRDVLE